MSNFLENQILLTLFTLWFSQILCIIAILGVIKESVASTIFVTVFEVTLVAYYITQEFIAYGIVGMAWIAMTAMYCYVTYARMKVNTICSGVKVDNSDSVIEPG